jgi:hypothetical protein
MLRTAVACLVLLVAIPSVAEARQAHDFSRLKLRIGDHVFVTDRATGEEFGGVLARLSATELVVAGRLVTPRPGLIIERRGDPVWEGAVIAGAIGAIVGVQVGHEACLDRSKWWCAAQGAAIYAAMGALYDALHTGRTTVYRTASAPVAAFRTKSKVLANRMRVAGEVALSGGDGFVLSASLVVQGRARR